MGACAFYHIWIPHYTHIAEPLYGLLKKGRKFKWGEEHTEVIPKLKGMLTAISALRKVIYGKESLIFVTVINQEEEHGA